MQRYVGISKSLNISYGSNVAVNLFLFEDFLGSVNIATYTLTCTY